MTTNWRITSSITISTSILILTPVSGKVIYHFAECRDWLLTYSVMEVPKEELPSIFVSRVSTA